MVIESIKLENFRNYETLELTLDPGTNIFYGENAQGKTNILESVYLCGTTKSHKGSKDREMIDHRVGHEWPAGRKRRGRANQICKCRRRFAEKRFFRSGEEFLRRNGG